MAEERELGEVQAACGAPDPAANPLIEQTRGGSVDLQMLRLGWVDRLIWINADNRKGA